MNNCRPGIEPAITGTDGGGQRHRLVSRTPTGRRGRWRLPVPALARLATRLAAVGAIALTAIPNYTLAAIDVDYDVMFVLVGVSPAPGANSARRLTYAATRLGTVEKDYLTTTGGMLQVYKQWRPEWGGGLKLFSLHPLAKVGTVTQWNAAVGGVPQPTPGVVVTVTAYNYELPEQRTAAACMGFAPGDNAATETLRFFPGTMCLDSVASWAVCSTSVTDVIDLGFMTPGATDGGRGKITVSCSGGGSATVKLGPIYLANEASDLVGYVGDRDCRGFAPTGTTRVAAGSTENLCLHVQGAFYTAGVKRIPGVLMVRYE